MSMRKPPKKFLIDSFDYYEYVGLNDWNEAVFNNVGVTVNNCRIDKETEFRTGTEGRELLFESLIFCYKGLTDPLPDFKEGSKVVFDEKEHRITRVIRTKEPYKNEIYSYEIEVI